jgi:hypothetical protein
MLTRVYIEHQRLITPIAIGSTQTYQAKLWSLACGGKERVYGYSFIFQSIRDLVLLVCHLDFPTPV